MINKMINKMINNPLLIEKTSYEEAKEKVLKMKWKVESCLSGDVCWCRTIVPDENIEFDDGYGGKTIFDSIVSAGSISKIFAEHIVEIHNKSLENY